MPWFTEFLNMGLFFGNHILSFMYGHMADQSGPKPLLKLYTDHCLNLSYRLQCMIGLYALNPILKFYSIESRV